MTEVKQPITDDISDFDPTNRYHDFKSWCI